MVVIEAAVGVGWVVSPVISLLINKIGTYIEIKYFKKSGTKKYMKEMRTSLREILLMVVIVEKQRIVDPNEVQLVQEIKDAVYDAEDCLDEFGYNLIEEKSAKQLKMDSGVAASCSSHIHEKFKQKVKEYSSKKLDRSILGDTKFKKKLKEVTESLNRAKESAKTLLQLMNTKNGHKQEKPTPINSSLISEEIIGRKKECEWLIDQLFEELEGLPTIISIVGPGGIGKTILTQMVFSDSRVKDHFELKIWLTVSDNFDKVELTKQMLKHVCKNFSTTDASLDTLQKKIKKELASKKVLLMLDDVWYVKDVNKKISYEQDLSSLLVPLNFAKAGSKVIVTNREDSVVSCWGPSRLVRSITLDGLTANDSWSLFKFWAFDARNQNNRQYLEPIGRKIVRKLKGLALAIRVIGEELRGISNIEEWKQILNDNSLDNGNIMNILCRSYDHLPEYLQRCFAYCSLFPKGTFLKPDRVVQMWIAQGFVHPRRGTSLEKIGQCYFKELIARSFIQEIKYDNKKYYVMPNFLNDLACHVSKGECHIFKEGDTIETLGSIRHLCVTPGTINIIKDIPGLDKLRTLIFQSSTSFDDKFIIDEIFIKLIRVRVLDIEWCLKSFPNVAKCKHLRYLCFRNYDYNLAQNYFSKLHHLAALFIRKRAFYYDEYHYDRLILPSSMRTMSSLGFIDVSKSILVDVVEQVPLQTLLRGSGFFFVNKRGKKLGLLRDINNIKKYLEITGLEKICSKDAMEAQLGSKKHVTGLRLSWSDSRSKVKRNRHHEVLEALKPNQTIERLMIDGYPGDVCPSWLESNLLSEIKSIKLQRCNGLKWLPALGQLQKLKKLCIESIDAVCRISDEFYGNDTFPSLEVLIIKNMRCLEEWSFPRGVKTFPKLCKLNIHCCPKLVAPEWDRFPALQWLKIWGCDAIIIKEQLNEYGGLSALTVMEINNCKKVNSLEGLRELFSLKDLTISNCPNLVSFSEREFYSLKSLEIGDCPKLRSLPKKGLPVSLRSLMIRGADHDLENQILSKSGKEWNKVDAISGCYCDISGKIVKNGWS